MSLRSRARALAHAGGTVTVKRSASAVTAAAGDRPRRISSTSAGRRPALAVPIGVGGRGLELVDVDLGALGFDREHAMSLPSISRARNLICSAVAALPFTFWKVDLTQIPAVERRTPPLSWGVRPDPELTRQHLLAWTVDDLIFYERSYWEITSRFADTAGNYPRTFRRIAPGNLEANADGATATVTDEITGARRTIAVAELVEFCSPIEGLLSNGWRAISIALQLDAAADRFAGNEIPAGVLEEQDGSEDMSADELAELAEQFSAARLANTTAATNKYVRYREIHVDASAMQLVEGREYQALELSRLGNIPPYLTGAPAGTGMTYQNGQQARQDLIDFGAAPYIGCIEQTLSGPRIVPAGTAVRLDLNAWLRNPFTTSGAGGELSPTDIEIAVTDTPATEVAV